MSSTMSRDLAFRRWFEGSKVVYEDGHPLMVYHGTDSAITAFDAGTSRHGFWFTACESDASDYGRSLMQCYLSIKNPAYFGRIRGDSGVNEAIQAARANGHDGLIVTAPEDGDEDGMYWPTNYVAFHPGQIKSAVENCGTFDPTNPSIFA